MLPPELLKQYIQEGKLTPEGPDRILLPSSSDLVIPSPHAIITSSTSTFTHYLLSENEPVSTCTCTCISESGNALCYTKSVIKNILRMLMKFRFWTFALTHTQSAVPHVSIDTEILKFGYCPPNQLSESKVGHVIQSCTCTHISTIQCDFVHFQLVSITNHTAGTLCFSWVNSKIDRCYSILWVTTLYCLQGPWMVLLSTQQRGKSCLDKQLCLPSTSNLWVSEWVWWFVTE